MNRNSNSLKISPECVCARILMFPHEHPILFQAKIKIDMKELKKTTKCMQSYIAISSLEHLVDLLVPFMDFFAITYFNKRHLRCFHFLVWCIVLIFYFAVADFGRSQLRRHLSLQLLSFSNGKPRSCKEVLVGSSYSCSAKLHFIQNSFKGYSALMFDDFVVSQLVAPFALILVGKFLLRHPNLDVIYKYFANIKLSRCFYIGLLDLRHITI
ncbi:hypothetical protein IEQ34_018604 [Dendrobium chrysotoxum]|uniref:Uncharacterized protein n=1 Tax=Dendrobium chrysotoxum TaxID=161865 RepID=A0AAV7FNU8_DENCH|nr:hypothetical protein IEQ34_018604 [Dendrobium chrysotoxum]